MKRYACKECGNTFLGRKYCRRCGCTSILQIEIEDKTEKEANKFQEQLYSKDKRIAQLEAALLEARGCDNCANKEPSVGVICDYLSFHRCSPRVFSERYLARWTPGNETIAAAFEGVGKEGDR